MTEFDGFFNRAIYPNLNLISETEISDMEHGILIIGND
jgi:hypothetical protein